MWGLGDGMICEKNVMGMSLDGGWDGMYVGGKES